MKALILSCFLAFLFGTNVESTSNDCATTERDYYVNVYVSYPDGGAYSGCKVQAKVCGALGGMTQAVRTNSRGYATLSYTSHSDLCYIYINGKAYDGRWGHGTTASFVAR